jgi:hypothetical protein
MMRGELTTKRWPNVGGMSLIAALVGLLWWSPWEPQPIPEPVYNGKPLTQWLAGFVCTSAPEQQAAYVQLEQETERDSTRVTACRNALDMVQLLQSNIGLDQQQQDKAFPALMEYGQQKVRYDAKRQDYDAYPTAEEDLTQLTLKALKGILTDEQMAIYR